MAVEESDGLFELLCEREVKGEKKKRRDPGRKLQTAFARAHSPDLSVLISLQTPAVKISASDISVKKQRRKKEHERQEVT